MAVYTNALRRSPDVSQKTDRDSYEAFLTRLAVYDTISMDINGDTMTMIRKKKQEEILEFIKTFHNHAVSPIGGSGRFAGFWQTTVGKGRGNLKPVRTKTLEEMLKYLAGYYDLSDTVLPRRKKITLESYFPHWLEWKGKRNNNKSCTLYHNKVDFAKYVAGTALSKMPLTSITPEDLDDWAREILIRKPMSAKRFNTYKIVVTGPLELAVREKIITSSPWKPELMDYRLLFKSPRRRPSQEKIFYEDEIRHIISVCLASYEETRNSANYAVIINFDLGLRVSELSALKWSDIDWRKKTVFIQRQESQREVEDYVKSDSACGYRELPLNDHNMKLLQRLRQDFGLVSEYIFSDDDGCRKTSKAIQKRLIYAQVGKNGDTASSGVKRIHCQRRTVGTRIAKHCGLEAARQWLGHTDLKTTLHYIYTTETEDSMRAYSQAHSAMNYLQEASTAERLSS